MTLTYGYHGEYTGDRRIARLVLASSVRIPASCRGSRAMLDGVSTSALRLMARITVARLWYVWRRGIM